MKVLRFDVFAKHCGLFLKHSKLAAVVYDTASSNLAYPLRQGLQTATDNFCGLSLELQQHGACWDELGNVSRMLYPQKCRSCRV